MVDKVTIEEAFLLKYLSNKVNPEERLLVEQWLEASEENRRIAEQIYYIKYSADTVHALQAVDAKNDLGKVWKKIRKHNRQPWWIIMQRAAAVLCIFLIPAIIYLLAHDDKDMLAGVTMSVPKGSISSLLLPDGSKVWLNADSYIAYGEGYGIKNRQIQLCGEGFFEVQHNPRLPLEVITESVTVRALGTEFNVKAYPEENEVSALLTEGLIEIEVAGQTQRKTLRPQQMAVYNKKDNTLAVASDVKSILYTSWKDMRWLIEGATLGDLAPILQRRYAIKVLFDDDVLKTYKFRGEVQNQTIEQMAKALQLTAPMTYEMHNDTLVFFLDTKRKKEFDKILKTKN